MTARDEGPATSPIRRPQEMRVGIACRRHNVVTETGGPGALSQKQRMDQSLFSRRHILEGQLVDIGDSIQSDRDDEAGAPFRYYGVIQPLI